MASPEFQAMLECSETLAETLGKLSTTMAEALFSAKLISEDTKAKMGVNTYIDKQKGSILVDDVRSKVKINEKRFEDFTRVLKRNGCEDAVKSLEDAIQSKLDLAAKLYQAL